MHGELPAVVEKGALNGEDLGLRASMLVSPRGQTLAK
jgi:hypothetical protein